MFILVQCILEQGTKMGGLWPYYKATTELMNSVGESYF